MRNAPARSIVRTVGRWFIRLTGGALVLALVLVLGTYVAARFYFWPRLDAMATANVVALETQLGTRVRWQALDTDWRGLRPTFELRGLTIGEGEGASRVEKIAGSLSLRALLHGHWGLHDLRLDRPTLSVLREGGSWRLAALPAYRIAADATIDSPAELARTVATWLTRADELRIGQGVILISDAAPSKAPALSLEGLDLVLRSHGRLHELRLDIARPDQLARRLTFQADVLRPSGEAVAQWQNWAGSLRVQGRDVDAGRTLSQLLAWLPELAPEAGSYPWSSVAGQLDPELRLAFRDGLAVDGRLALHSQRLSLAMTPDGEQQIDLSALEADLRWRQQDDETGSADAAAVAAGVGRGWRIELPVLVARGRATAVGKVKAVSKEALGKGDSSGDSRGESEPVSIVTGERGIVAQLGPERVGLAQLDVDLAEATLDAPFRWARAWFGPLERIDLGGLARPLRLNWQAPAQWRLAGSIDRALFALSPSAFELSHPKEPRVPGLRGLDLQFEATAQGGRATLSMPRGGQAAMTFGGIFAEPEVPFTELAATLDWKVLSWPAPGQPLRLALDVDASRLANADAAMRVRARYQADDSGHDGQIEVDAEVERGQARRLFRYLPHHLPQDVRDWIQKAFESGKLEQLRAQVRGRIKAFPYQAPDQVDLGSFVLTGRFADVLLRFAPDWPTIQQFGGQFSIDRAKLRLTAERASIGKGRIEGATVAIDDMTHAALVVRGQYRGDAGDLVRYVNASPLAGMAVGAVTRPLRADGPARLGLGVDWALHDKRSEPRVSGQLDLEGTDLTFEDGQPTLAGARGRISFTNDSLAFDPVTATIHGSPVEARGRSLGDDGMEISTLTRLQADSIRALTDNPLTRALDGVAEIRATMRFSTQGRSVEAQSDLVGLSSRLPAPLAKRAADAMPLRFTWTPQPEAAKPTERLIGTLGDSLRFVAERTAADAGRPLQITRAAVARGRAPQLPARGLGLQVTTDALDGDAWQAVFDDAATTTSTTASTTASIRPSTPPSTAAPTAAASRAAEAGVGSGLFAEDFDAEPVQVSLAVDALRFGGRRYRAFRLEGSRSGRLWKSKIEATGVSGMLDWERGGSAGPGGRLVGRFARLALPATLEGVAPTAPSSKERMPALDITAEDFSVGAAQLGRLELLATNLDEPLGWRLDRLALLSSAASFRAVGRFRSSTEMDYQLEIADAGKLLEQLGLKDVVRGGSGLMHGKVQWQSVPSNFDVASLGGELNVDVRNGQFLKADPGAAKLIGVLNLQALPKWLKFDFADLFAKGFAFQELSGHAVIDRGLARTDRFAMQGLEAVVLMTGEADLRRQTQDLQVTVLPHLDASLAALAYAAIINPAVGLGAFVAQSLLGRQLSRAFAYEFEVKGGWADPQVVERPRVEVGEPPGEWPPQGK